MASWSELQDASSAIAWMAGMSITANGGVFTPLQRKIRSSALQAGHNGDGNGFRRVLALGVPSDRQGDGTTTGAIIN